MSFQSFGFLAFLAVTCAVCVGVGRNRPAAGKVLLTAACIVFYLLEPRGLPGLAVLAVGILVTAWTARQLPHAHHRRRLLAAACAWHIAVLAVFKYTGFFTGGVVSVSWAPAGLSFFTFQQLWYLKTVADGSYVPRRGDGLVLYGLFFPTVTSGPILKPQGFFDQLAPGGKFLHPTWQDVSAGLYALCCGMAKKVLLADAFGVIVDNGWARVGDLSAPAAWLVILGYTLQLYFDFSGYCDMAAGAARLLGIRLPVNFDSPYRSCSVGEFWKRWHITLTSFFRECVYFPLGGSRRGTARTCVNILLIFLLSGLWHGAGWTFVVWGALHGLGQVAERLWGPGRERLPGLIRWGITFLFINLAWVFFRAPDLTGALSLLSAAATGGAGAPGEWLLEGLLSSEMEAAELLVPQLAGTLHALAAGGLYVVGLLAVLLPGNTIRRMETFRPTAWRCVVLAGLAGWSILSFTGITTFIYSNF